MLATLQQLKDQMGWASNDDDALATTLIQAASAQAEELAKVKLQRATSIKEYPHKVPAHTHRIRLSTVPIESISELAQLYWPGNDSDFDNNAEILTDPDDYVIASDELGMLEAVGRRFFARVKCLRVTYTAGFYDPSQNAPTAEAQAPPPELKHGVVQQAIRLWQNRKTAGVRELDLGDQGGVSLAETKIHFALHDAVMRYKRLM